MFSKLQLQNFQGFGKLPAEIPLAPLTLIYGGNASGKSSILRSLLLCKQSLQRNSIGLSNGFNYEGSSISLASFRNVVHKHERDSDFIIKYRIIPTSRLRENSASDNLANMINSVECSWTVDIHPVPKSLTFKVFFKEVSDPFEIEFIRKAPNQVRTMHVGSFEGAQSISLALANYKPKPSFVYEPRVEEGDLVATDLLLSNLDLEEFDNLIGTEVMLRNNFPVMFTDQLSTNFRRVLQNLFRVLNELNLYEFSRVKHVGPLRSIAERLVYQGGITTGDLESSGPSKPVRLGAEVVKDWLLKMTGGRYRLEPVDFYAENVEFLGSLTSQILIDTVTDTPVTFADVGVGLSQIKPILEALSRMERAFPQTVLIEQPELHLHPAMQGELADLFLTQLSQCPGSQIIAETHSEAFLTRIQKRLRLGDFDENLVRILYVDQIYGGHIEGGQSVAIEPSSTVFPLEFDADNSYTIEIPNTFFSFSHLRFGDQI
jgi:predicted ATPase